MLLCSESMKSQPLISKGKFPFFQVVKFCFPSVLEFHHDMPLCGDLSVVMETSFSPGKYVSTLMCS